MVDRIESRRLLIPATFGSGNVTFTDLDFTQGIVRSVAIAVPRGVRGFIGVGLGYGGQVIIPNTRGELIYTDDEIIEWPVDGLPVGERWQLVTDPQAYNDHFIGIRMSVDEIPAPGLGQPAASAAEQVMALAGAAPVEAMPDLADAGPDDTAGIPTDPQLAAGQAEADDALTLAEQA